MKSVSRAVFMFLFCVVVAFGQQRSAKDFYQQLYDAGGFFDLIHTTEGGTVPVKMQSHVCFSDEASATDFFTFQSYAYDQLYAKTFAAFSKTPSQSDLATMQTISDRAPYINWMTDESLALWPAASQKYFRQEGGGRILVLDWYMKGVKTKTAVEYHWWKEKEMWMTPEEAPDPKAYSQKTVTSYLSIEPKTLRWARWKSVDIVVGEGSTAARDSRTYNLGNGVCEAIKDHEPKKKK
jgi:hypothetical protein